MLNRASTSVPGSESKTPWPEGSTAISKCQRTLGYVVLGELSLATPARVAKVRMRPQDVAVMEPQEHADASDPFDLARFVSAQEGVFDVTIAELRRGQKRSHWVWFIFPQVQGLGKSLTSNKYAIRSLDEARAYLNHPVLGPRLLECCRAILSVQGKSASEIMGYPDDLKLRSSMTLFALADDSHPGYRLSTSTFRGIWMARRWNC